MYRLPLVFLLAALMIGCSNPSPAPAAAPKDDASRSVIEERLITELAPTTDRAGQQRNAIINRAIDQHYDIYAAPEGYFYEILSPGEYGNLAEGDLVSAHYRGSFLDGTVFDDSRQRSKPLRFRLGDLIPAWNLGLQRIKPGGAIRLIAPSELAYGADGLISPRGDTLVPAHTVLEFVIDEIDLFEE